MKRLPIFLFFSLLTVSFARSQDTETRNLGSFSGVKAMEGVDVYLKKGDKESARIEVTGTNANNVITEVSGSYLKVHMKDGNYRSVDAKVYVTYVNLDKISASSAGNIFSEDAIRGRSFDIGASSAGSVEITLDGETAEVSSSSAGEVELKGKLRRLSADASSAGEIDAYDLDAEEVEVEVSSGASAKVNVARNLNAHASSGGSVRYRGNPERSNTTSSSGGSVKKSN